MVVLVRAAVGVAVLVVLDLAAARGVVAVVVAEAEVLAALLL